MQFPVGAYESEIAEIVAGVYQTMVGESVVPANVETVPPPRAITAAIFFAGEWKGALLVECTEEQARVWTGKLMSIEEPTGICDDVHDAMAELVNMVGGNLKPVLPKGVGLSAPTVVEGRSFALEVCGGNLVNRQSFAGEHGTFWVTLVEEAEP